MRCRSKVSAADKFQRKTPFASLEAPVFAFWGGCAMQSNCLECFCEKVQFKVQCHISFLITHLNMLAVPIVPYDHRLYIVCGLKCKSSRSANRFPSRDPEYIVNSTKKSTFNNGQKKVLRSKLFQLIVTGGRTLKYTISSVPQNGSTCYTVRPGPVYHRGK